MSDIKLTVKNIKVENALAQIDAFPGLETKRRNCLRLLTEEMFSMMENVLNHKEATFKLTCDGNEYSLSLLADVEVSEKNKETYMSISTDGKNTAHKGIIGKMTALVESLSNVGPYYPMVGLATLADTPSYSYLWSMTQYLEENKEEDDDNWDGLEKSIIANFADDVLIGVLSNKLEMKIKKSF